jgi:hypothetical protein
VYENKEYVIYNEDEIIFSILKFISENKTIKNEKKYTIKSRILKKIKESYHIHRNIPDSETIQKIFDFFVPNIFKTKEETKYFLTVIGDISLKKNEKTFFINNSMKKLISKINEIHNIYFCVTNFTNHFKLKYYTHDKKQCRVMNTTLFNMEYFNLSLNFFIDLICVSIHHSSRYGNSESYMLNEVDDDHLMNKIMFIENHENDNTTIEEFQNHMIIEDKTSQGICDNEMVFLWKTFCDKFAYGINLFHKNENFITKLREKITYDDQNKMFVNVSNKYMPKVTRFIDFWNDNFYHDEKEFFLEVTEVLSLFKTKDGSKKSRSITEAIAIDLMKQCDPSIIIIDNKYIQSYGCILWNKKRDIDNVLKSMNIKTVTNGLNIHKIYLDYCIQREKERKVSKKYFETYIEENCK